MNGTTPRPDGGPVRGEPEGFGAFKMRLRISISGAQGTRLKGVGNKVPFLGDLWVGVY